MKKLHLLTLVALIMLGFSGCEKVTVEKEAIADVFVKTIKNAQGITVFSAVHSVISTNGDLKAVSVKSPDGTTTQLIGDLVDPGFSFYNEPAEADYSTTLPIAGSYAYTVKFNDDEEKPYTNSLSSIFLLPANITSLAKSADGDSVYISWEPIANVQLYQLKVLKGTTQVSASNGFTITGPIGIPITSLNSSGSGVYTFQLTGFYFESTTSYNLQAISTAKMDIAL